MYYIGSSGKNRAMSAGRLSIMAFQIVRPLSYPGESDVRSSPRMFPFSSLTAVSVISNLPLEVTTCKFRILDEGDFSRDKTVSDNSQIAMRGFWHTLIARGWHSQ